MKRNKIIIIGAGIAGLSTGCYARMNGYETTVFEMSDKPGGVCTSWQRKGYTFDYCIHNLAGTGKKSRMRPVWDELGAFEGTDIVNNDAFVQVEAENGESLIVYSQLSRLEQHLKDIAPGDTKLIDDFIGAARRLQKADLLGMLAGGRWATVRLLPYTFTLAKWGKVSLDDIAARFSNPFLRRAFGHVHYDTTGPEMVSVAHLMFVAGLNAGDLGRPRGGSLAFSRRIEERLKSLGGTVHYGSRVVKILVEGNRAVGVRLADGTEHSADMVISAADGYSTIYGMLDGRYTNRIIDAFYRAYPAEQAFGLQVYLGVDRDVRDEPHAVTLLLDNPVKLEGTDRDSLYIELFSSETGFAPEGKSVVKVVTRGTYDYWAKLRTNIGEYRKEKGRVADTVLQVLERRFPAISRQVEVVDVTTPVTAERYTNNFHGWQPWPPPFGLAKVMQKGLSKTLPGLRDFYMVGQWASAMIGVSTAAALGRNLVREICREDGRRFGT